MVRHYIWQYEKLMKLRFKVCSLLKGERVEQTLCIFDMTGCGVSVANSQTYGLCKLAAKVGSDYYPEIMGNFLIVNAPMLFSGIWAVVKGFLDEKTRGKIKIIGSNFMPTVQQYLDHENIPTFLGGGNEVDLNIETGPWMDYEVHGTSIRLKSDNQNPPEERKESEEEEVKVNENEAEPEEVKQAAQ